MNAALNQVLKNKPVGLNPKYSPPVRTLNSKNSVAPLVSISDMNLAAINVGENREVETTLAEQTEKFIGYFTLKHGPNISSSEIYIVVTQPDGHVIQSSPWEAGSFETTLGRKSYSCKLNFDGSRNESTRMQFSINGEGFEKGNYNIQVYHDGAVVKKWVKTLF